MKKSIVVIVVVLALLLVSTLPVQAAGRFYHGGFHGGGFRGGVWIGPGWGWGWGWNPWLWGAPYYYPYYDWYYPYYTAPPVGIQQEPQEYVEPAPQPEEQSYWYFCSNPQGYYPYVKKCPGGWRRVLPRSVPPDYESGRDQAPAPADERR
ncbi:MAG TPA: hypothetical protein VEJ88_04730 [Dissulfurispiraceae bacterium]|nr:hypothetical protein [Dissulfurispiraceae bacterium]